jgi:hypothetical protein
MEDPLAIASFAVLLAVALISSVVMKRRQGRSGGSEGSLWDYWRHRK